MEDEEKHKVMITFLINQETKERIESLDMDAQFMEGMHILVPLWSPKRMVVSEVVLAAKVEGSKEIGQRASFVQNVFLKNYEQEEDESTVN